MLIKSIELYSLLKLNLMEIVKSDYDFKLDKEQLEYYIISQQDNDLFSQIRHITGDVSKFNKYAVFVDCKNGKNKKDIMGKIIRDGFKLNDIEYTISEKSSSMSRQGVLLFVKKSISEQLDEIVTMGIDTTKETVLAKYLAYRGLVLSSSWDIPDYKPYCIVVDDYYKIIPNQKIIGVVDNEKSYINKEGKEVKYKEKGTLEETKDIEINCFDGSGICHPRVVDKIKETLEAEHRPNVFIFRMPFVKGLLAEVDFVKFYEERGVYEITDLWGKKHSIYDIDIIMTKSQYKAYGYFNKTGTYQDYEYYWEMFNKYNHSFRVAKINYSFENEPSMTKINYQVLQTLNLDEKSFLSLANYSKEWIEKIICGDDVIATMCFLGLKNNKFKASNAYMKAILKNPAVVKDMVVRKYLNKSLQKNIDDFKTGRLYVEGSFQFLFGDIIAMMEHIGGLEVKGVLEADEFFSQDANGIKLGEHTLLRNPHITGSENRRLVGVTDTLLEEYAKGLSNVIMVNHKSLILNSLNGSDLDGDIVLVVKNKTISDSCDMEQAIVLDTNDKATALKQIPTKENLTQTIIKSMHSIIGELSNLATRVWNRVPRSEEEKIRQKNYVDLLSVTVGKSIDAAKTGVTWLPPKIIAKSYKSVPYFMKYISDYYKKTKEFSYSPSNMNKLAWHIEKSEYKLRKQMNHNKKDNPFDHSIMIDNSIQWNAETFLKIESLYKDFQKEIKELKKQQRMSYKSPEYYNYFGESKYKDVSNSFVDWNEFFSGYKAKAKELCPNDKELANYTVTLCYEKDSNDKNFAWIVSETGLLENIKPVEHELPVYDINGEYEYLGKHYSLEPYIYSDESILEDDIDSEDLEDEENYDEEARLQTQIMRG